MTTGKNKVQVPPRKFGIGDIVRIIDHDDDDQNGINVVTGIRLGFLSFFRRHYWEYRIEDRFSSAGWFDEEKIESATPQNDDEADYITGGNVPFRDMVTCTACKAVVVAELLGCPICSADLVKINSRPVERGQKTNQVNISARSIDMELAHK